MAKSMRSKREKRLRAIRRDIVKKEAFYENKETAKLAAQAAALAAPKLPVRSPFDTPMEITTTNNNNNATTSNTDMDVEMAGGDKTMEFLKPVRVVGKKLKKKIKLAKKKRNGKGKIRRKHNV